MFAVGHLALGYLSGKATSKLANVKVNIPLLFLASILPDIDLLIGLEHRGPTHSLIVYIIIFVPAFWMFGKQVVPFFVSLASHSLLGDLFTGGGVQMLWPAVTERYGAQIQITSALNISLEWIAFLMSMTLLMKTRDITSLFQHHPSNLLLTIPVAAIILPAFLSFPLGVPLTLVVPHLVFLTILGLSIMTDLRQILRIKR